MAKEKENLQERDTILTCTMCGKRGEVVIGDKGKELCSACLSKVNEPKPNELKPFQKLSEEEMLEKNSKKK